MIKQKISRVSILLALIGLTLSVEMTRAQTLVTESDTSEIFTVVEDMPIPWLYKTECLEVPSVDKRDCYMGYLNTWLGNQLVYPEKAMRNKTEGFVITRFIIDKTGSVRNAEVVKDIGDGCGEAALRAIEKMPDWVPGRQRGVPVNVAYTIPVKFELK